MSETHGYKDEMTERDGLMRQERQVLIAIHQRKIPADIARELGVTPQRIGAVRSTLVKKNWLARVPIGGTKKASYLVPESKLAAVEEMIGDTIEQQSAEPPTDDPGRLSDEQSNRWEFVGRPPSVLEVKALLDTLPLVHGIRTAHYFEYVQAIPDFREVTRPNPDRPGSMVTDRVEVWRLYMSVAGRLSMLNAAQALNGWRVDIVPEPSTPNNPAGFLSMAPYIVYREHIKVWAPLANSQGAYLLPLRDHERFLGSRTGQAGKPFSGSSYPVENVETSARGRALGGWGFGVFPGSGIASLDEMLSLAASKRTEQAADDGRPVRGTGAKQTKEELMEDVLTTNEQLRQLMGSDEDTMLQRMGEYLESLGAKVWDAEQKSIDWDRVKPGQLVMLLGKLDERRRQWAAETSL